MPTPRKSAAHADEPASRFASVRPLGGVSRSGVFLAALPLAAAWLLAAPARATAAQNLFVVVNGTSTGNTNNGGSGVTGNSVMEYAGGTGSPILYGNVIEPDGLCIDSSGDLFVESTTSILYEILPGGVPMGNDATVVSSVPAINYGYGLAIDQNSNIYISRNPEGAPGPVQITSPPYSTYSTFETSPDQKQPYGIAVDASGDVWVSNIAHANGNIGSVEEFSSTGTYMQTIGTTGASPFIEPVALAFDSAGDLYVTDIAGGEVYKFAASTYAETTFASGLTDPFGIAIDASGDVYVSTFQATGSIYEYSSSGTLVGGAPIETGLTYPTFIALSAPTVSGIEWAGMTSGDWEDGTNWTGGTPPGIADATNATAISTDTALFDLALTSNTTVTVDSNRNVMNITFDTAAVSAMTLTGGPLLLTSGGVIQITAPVVNPQIINAPLVLEGNYTFTSGATLSTATLSFGGGITSGAASGTTTLTLNGSNTGPNTISGVLADGTVGSNLAVAVSGTGVWVLNGATSTYTGGTTIASGATLELAGSVSALSQTMNVVNSGSLLVTGGNQTLGKLTGTGSVSVTSGSLTAYQIVQNSLTIAAGATVTLVPSGSGSTTNPTGPNNINFSSTLTSLSIAGSTGAWTGTLDIGNNGLVIAYGNPANDPYATIDNMIETGFDSAHWDGMGITSSLGRAAAESHTPLNIGLLDFTPGTGIYSQTTFIVFAGQTVTTNAILIRLTYMDDVNMYGDMSAQHAASDALTFAANYGSGTTWSVGDLTHQGLVGSAAALLFASNYATGLASLDGTTGGDVVLGSGVAAVPEPASLLLAAVGALGLGLLARRRRKR